MRLVLLLAALLLVLAEPAAAASFDCTKAATPAEHATCASPKLSSLDDLVNRAYAEVRNGPNGTTSDADDRAKALDDMRAFAARKARCGASIACLVAAHAGALADLLHLGSSVAPPDSLAATDMTLGIPPETKTLPTREGTCVRTHVKDIGPRLEGADFSSGTTVILADELAQVSYERVDAIVASRRGDPVLACLVSIPRHCPPGDDRGRFYTATNLRTRRSWTLPDSQHMCGGA